ncbi:hypothetical protein ACH5RR_026638 [Cinchona calisaya]|uniref:Uncharacterized protein n=1 Tax=Cinchona calisaya TaxID=153742 RepID=A0ABD2Z350_9GENT
MGWMIQMDGPKTGLFVQSPNYGRGRGRPKKLRRKNLEELRKSKPIVNPNKPNMLSKVGGKLRCSYCQQYAGRNKTNCPKRAFDLGTNNDKESSAIKESSASLTSEVIGVSVPRDPTLTGQDVSVQSNHLGLNLAKFQPFTWKGNNYITLSSLQIAAGGATTSRGNCPEAGYVLVSTIPNRSAPGQKNEAGSRNS